MRVAGLGLALALGCGAGPDRSAAHREWKPVHVAVGSGLDDLRGLDARVRRAFEAGPEDFAPLPPPGPGDWLAIHHEVPQGVGSYWLSQPNRPGAEGRDTIDFVPLGDVPSLEAIRRHVVFGLASLPHRTGVFSLRRYDPRFAQAEVAFIDRRLDRIRGDP